MVNAMMSKAEGFTNVCMAGCSGRSLRFRQNLSRRRLQAFDEFKQKYKQMCSIGINTLKHTVFLDENKFRLRILVEKPIVSQTLPKKCA